MLHRNIGSYTRATRRHIPEDGSHRHDDLNSSSALNQDVREKVYVSSKELLSSLWSNDSPSKYIKKRKGNRLNINVVRCKRKMQNGPL
jgi:hypothetical protein